MADALVGEVFLRVQRSTGRSLRVTGHSKLMPRLEANERAFRVRFTMPAELFSNPPVATVEVTLDAEHVAVGRATVEVLDPAVGPV